MRSGGFGVVAAALLSAGLLSLSASDGGAQPAAPGGAQAKGKKPPPVDVKSLGEKLRSGEPERLTEALAAAQAAGPAAATLTPAIEEILKRGASNDVAKAAIDALGAIGQPAASGTLRPYVRHRSQDLRRAAVKALVNTKGPEALAAFKEGLRASDPLVRGFSATGLGNMGAHESLPELFEALDHNLSEAAAAIGQLCAPDECEKFASRLGKIGLDVMTSGFDPILFRTKPLPDETLLRIVGRLRELGTRESGKYLGDVQGRWPKTGSPRVKQAIDSAVTAVPGAKGS